MAFDPLTAGLSLLGAGIGSLPHAGSGAEKNAIDAQTGLVLRQTQAYDQFMPAGMGGIAQQASMNRVTVPGATGKIFGQTITGPDTYRYEQAPGGGGGMPSYLQRMLRAEQAGVERSTRGAVGTTLVDLVKRGMLNSGQLGSTMGAIGERSAERMGANAAKYEALADERQTGLLQLLAQLASGQGAQAGAGYSSVLNSLFQGQNADQQRYAGLAQFGEWLGGMLAGNNSGGTKDNASPVDTYSSGGRYGYAPAGANQNYYPF